jgi:hypothetical protein
VNWSHFRVVCTSIIFATSWRPDLHFRVFMDRNLHNLF